MFTFTEAALRGKFKPLLKKMASNNEAEAMQAQTEFAQGIAVPLRETLLSGDILNGIYVTDDYSQTDTPPMYMLDVLVPGDEAQHYAYVMPNHGHIPQRKVESDYLMVPTYEIGSSIDCNIKIIEKANWPVIRRLMQILEAGFIKKMNDDGMQTIISAAVDRNILITDPNASPGQFTPRLVSLTKTFMRRNGGGNSATMNQSRLTDLYLSPEAIDDVRAWNLDLIPDPVRTNIYYSEDNGQEVISIYGVKLHDLFELGEGQEYQNYYTNVLGGAMGASDVEFGIGLDLTNRENSFVSPVVKDLEMFEDNTLFRKREFGMWGWTERGYSVLDSRRTVLVSL